MAPRNAAARRREGRSLESMRRAERRDRQRYRRDRRARAATKSRPGGEASCAKSKRASRRFDRQHPMWRALTGGTASTPKLACVTEIAGDQRRSDDQQKRHEWGNFKRRIRAIAAAAFNRSSNPTTTRAWRSRRQKQTNRLSVAIIRRACQARERRADVATGGVAMTATERREMRRRHPHQNHREMAIASAASFGQENS